MLAVTMLVIAVSFSIRVNISPSALTLSLKWGLSFSWGYNMKQVDYVRMAEKCAREADRMPPGPERDELL
jgi:hypothetical protein